MQITTALIKQNKRNFLPANFELKAWEDLETFYKDLDSRSINNETEFEQWFRDWDELYAVTSEDTRWKYINTSIDTTDKVAQELLQNYQMNINPKVQPWENKLQKKFNDSPFKDSLSLDFTNVKKGIANDLSLFTEKNIELNKDLSIQEQEYASITGAWSIEYKGKELTMPQARNYLKSTDRNEREEVYLLSKIREAKDANALDELLSELVKKTTSTSSKCRL